MHTPLKTTLLSAFLFITATLGILSAHAAWSPPVANPPGNNAPSPINVSGSAQLKTGELQLSDKLRFVPGGVGSGSVTADGLGVGFWRESGAFGVYVEDGSGNVGVGTASPEAKLHVAGGDILVDRNRGLRTKNGAGNPYNLLWADPSDQTNIYAPGNDIAIIFSQGSAGERMRIGAKGNVGIGTASPAGKLTIDGPGGSVASGIELHSQGNTTGYVGWVGRIYSGTPTGSWGTAPLTFSVPNTSGGEIRTLNLLNGNVGIGTVSPGAPLEVNRTSDGGILRLNRQSVASWDFGIRNTPTLAGLQPGSLEILPQNANIDFSVGAQGGAVGLVVKNTGNVGIGTVSPTAKLDVRGGALKFGDTSGYIIGAPTFGLRINNNSDTLNVIIAKNNGDVEIPSGALSVSGNITSSGTVCDSVGCIGAATTPSLQAVTDAGSITTRDVTMNNITVNNINAKFLCKKFSLLYRHIRIVVRIQHNKVLAAVFDFLPVIISL